MSIKCDKKSRKISQIPGIFNKSPGFLTKSEGNQQTKSAYLQDVALVKTVHLELSTLSQKSDFVM
jgi:hypothetical protein